MFERPLRALIFPCRAPWLQVQPRKGPPVSRSSHPPTSMAPCAKGLGLLKHTQSQKSSAFAEMRHF